MIKVYESITDSELKLVAEEILDTHDDKMHRVDLGQGVLVWNKQVGGNRYLVTIYKTNTDFERFWVYESSTVDDACDEISKSYNALFYDNSVSDIFDVSDVSFRMSKNSPYPSKDSWDEDLILKVIDNTEYPITYKSGYEYHNSKKSTDTLSKYQARKIIKNNSFVDVECKNGKIFINTYSENDMW